jgi:hypothetical protein
MKKNTFLSLTLTFLVLLTGCRKLLDVGAPTTSVTSANVYSSDATAIAAVTGIYTGICNSNFQGGGLSSMSLFPGLSADELGLFQGSGNDYQLMVPYYTNNLSAITTGSADFWTVIYPLIYTANAAIDGLSNNNSLTPAVDRQLLGEAKFVRALCYFYLVNLYGDVPLVTSTDYKASADAARASQAMIWQQVTSDLASAQSLLSQNYLDGTLLNNSSQRVRPTSWAATALLARTYLYRQVWDSAESEATLVINNTGLFGLTGLDTTFLAISPEAIWQLQPTSIGQNTPDAMTFIIPTTGPGSNWPVYLSSRLMNSFEPGDQRRVDWTDSVIAGGITYYYPFKYKVDSIGAPVTEYEMVLRLGEQFLVRAEARAQEGKTTGAEGALQDLNTIRERAGLPDYSGGTDAPSVLSAILHERQVELFTEWGHRWLDLKRTNSVDSVMGSPGGACAAKGGTWNSYQQWYPITQTELEHDPNLVQNSGY